MPMHVVFFFNDTATTEIYTLSLHDALPISETPRSRRPGVDDGTCGAAGPRFSAGRSARTRARSPRCRPRSEEHTSELQSRQYLVCRLLLEKKNKNTDQKTTYPGQLYPLLDR